MRRTREAARDGAATAALTIGAHHDLAGRPGGRTEAKEQSREGSESDDVHGVDTSQQVHLHHGLHEHLPQILLHRLEDLFVVVDQLHHCLHVRVLLLREAFQSPFQIFQPEE